MSNNLDFNAMMADEAAEAPELSESSMSRFTEVCNQLLVASDEVEQYKEKLSEAEESYKNLSETVLPELMSEMGLTEFKFENGTKVTISTVYTGNIKVDNREEAHAWLRDNGHGSLIKNEVTVSFGKNEDGSADSLVKHLEEAGYQPKRKESVHYQTLRAFAREQTEAGIALPPVIGVHVIQKAKLKKG